jgi:F-type H+-transporting ATPase subunit b
MLIFFALKQGIAVNRFARHSRMIDINIAFFIQLANFIVLLLALNFILFRPLRAIMREREEGIGGALSDAKAAQERSQALLEQYNISLADAKQKAAAAYNTLYQQGLDAQRDMISAERAKASELLDKARKEIAASAASARGDLRKEAEKLSLDISAKLLGWTA